MSTNGTNDTNATPEQRRPKDVIPRDDEDNPADDQSLAPTSVQPAGVKDESEPPVVNPVTGGAI